MTGTIAFHENISAIAAECFGKKQGAAQKFAAMVKIASESLTGKKQDLLFAKEVIDDAARLLKEQGASESKNNKKTMLARGRLAMIYTALALSIDNNSSAAHDIREEIKEKQKELLSGWDNGQLPSANKEPSGNTGKLEKMYKERLRGSSVFSV